MTDETKGAVAPDSVTVPRKITPAMANAYCAEEAKQGVTDGLVSEDAWNALLSAAPVSTSGASSQPKAATAGEGDYKAIAKRLSDALLKVRPIGGSELFIKFCDGYLADPEWCGAAIEKLRQDLHGANIELARLRKSTLAGERDRVIEECAATMEKSQWAGDATHETARKIRALKAKPTGEEGEKSFRERAMTPQPGSLCAQMGHEPVEGIAVMQCARCGEYLPVRDIPAPPPAARGCDPSPLVTTTTDAIGDAEVEAALTAHNAARLQRKEQHEQMHLALEAAQAAKVKP